MLPAADLHYLVNGMLMCAMWWVLHCRRLQGALQSAQAGSATLASQLGVMKEKAGKVRRQEQVARLAQLSAEVYTCMRPIVHAHTYVTCPCLPVVCVSQQGSRPSTPQVPAGGATGIGVTLSRDLLDQHTHMQELLHQQQQKQQGGGQQSPFAAASREPGSRSRKQTVVMFLPAQLHPATRMTK
jgi:hypothetical protein